MQGWRISMEDAHAAILDLQVENPDKAFQSASVDDRLSFFGVYDGHGGDKVALFAGENVHKIIAKQEAFKKGDIEQALKDGFLATDRAILNGTRGSFFFRGEESLIAVNRSQVRGGSVRLHSICRCHFKKSNIRGRSCICGRLYGFG